MRLRTPGGPEADQLVQRCCPQAIFPLPWRKWRDARLQLAPGLMPVPHGIAADSGVVVVVRGLSGL